MSISIQECADVIVNSSDQVMKINSIMDNQWYRKPKGPRKGPWYSGQYEIVNNDFWNKNEECIYFVRNSSKELLYVGISVNSLRDRWRTSPAYDVNENPLGKNEIFHSQCWPEICKAHKQGGNESYSISVLHGKKLQSVLSSLDHPISNLAAMKDDSDIAVIAIEVWFVKRFWNQLWNKRK